MMMDLVSINYQEFLDFRNDSYRVMKNSAS